MTGSLRKRRLLIFITFCIIIIIIGYIQAFYVLPGKITLLEGEEYIYNFKNPFTVNIKADKVGFISLNNGDIKANGTNVSLSNPLKIKPKSNGSVILKIRLFGIIPVKSMMVDIIPNKKIVACGNTIGVKMQLNGILVIGMTDVQTEDGKKHIPAKESGIKTGDVLIEVNQKKLENIDDLIRAVDDSAGKKIKFKYRRGNSFQNCEVTPLMDVEDKKYHLGLWVRDGTAGIGTLTFYDPENMSFGALGHGITDIDTGVLMPVDTGEILESNILTVKKGEHGNPGELRGIFLENSKLGTIHKNCEYGIYGNVENSVIKNISDRLYPIGLRNQIKEGPATILANIDGSKVEEYQIAIEKVSRQNIIGSKGMVIRITDKKLLEETGGIVQGMSGSPIIQDGKIVGAVTHVLVNDPTRGYGIYIEWMLNNTSEKTKSGNEHRNAS